MRKLSASFALGLALLATLAVAAGASHSNGAGPGHDFAVGTGQLMLPTAIGPLPSKIHVNAKSDADGSNASGHFTQDIDTGNFLGRVQFSGDVTCLNVTGNHAVISGVITKTTDNSFAPVGAGVIGEGNDNGEGNDPPDELHAIVTVAPSPDCSTSPGFTPTPIDRGNYVVHDAG
jgi:hypothetical protein